MSDFIWDICVIHMSHSCVTYKSSMFDKTPWSRMCMSYSYVTYMTAFIFDIRVIHMSHPCVTYISDFMSHMNVYITYECVNHFLIWHICQISHETYVSFICHIHVWHMSHSCLTRLPHQWHASFTYIYASFIYIHPLFIYIHASFIYIHASYIYIHADSYVSMPHSYISIPDSCISISHSYISMPHAYISMPHAYIYMPHACIYIHAWCIYISMPHSYTSMPHSYTSMPHSNISRLICRCFLHRSLYLSLSLSSHASLHHRHIPVPTSVLGSEIKAFFPKVHTCTTMDSVLATPPRTLAPLSGATLNFSAQSPPPLGASVPVVS